MSVKLRPAEAGFDVLALDRRGIILERSLPPSLEEGTDDDDAPDSNRQNRGDCCRGVEGFVVEAVPSTEQRCCGGVTGLCDAVLEKVIHQRTLSRRMVEGDCLGG